eukprot:3736894-Pyramimonas_sp.AAC.2
MLGRSCEQRVAPPSKQQGPSRYQGAPQTAGGELRLRESAAEQKDGHEDEKAAALHRRGRPATRPQKH